MLNACAVALVKSPFEESPACVCQTTYLIQWAHLHKRANEHCKNHLRGRGDSDLLLILASVNNGIMTSSETYIVSTTETNSVNSSITTLLEIYIMSITEHNRLYIYIYIKKKTTNLFYISVKNF